MNARPRVLLAAAITLWLAVPAAAARVVQLRVGEHPGFTRIVFELDAPAGYQLERKSGAAELTVTLEAASEARKVTRKSWDIRSVDVAAAQRAVAKIRLANPGLQLKEMILSNPPRIVLDVLREKPVVASAKRAVKQAAPRAEAKLAPPRPEDSQPAVPKTAKAEVVPPSASKPAAQPTPVADAKSTAATKPVADAKSAAATKPVEKTEPAPAPKPTAKPPVPATPIAKTEPAPAPKPEAKPAAVPKPAAEAKPVADAKPPAPATPAKPPTPPSAEAKSPSAKPAETPPAVKPVEKSIADTKSVAKPAETPPSAPKPAETAKPPADAKAAAPKAEKPATPSADAKASTTPAESKPIAEAAKPAAPPTPPGAKPVMTASDLTKLVADQLAQKDKASSQQPATPPAPATAATPAAKPTPPTPPPGATTQIDAKQPAPPPSKTAEAKPPAPVTPIAPIAPPAEVKLPAPVPPPAAEIAKPAPTPAPAPAELAKPAPAPTPIEIAKPAPPPPPVAPVPAPKPAAKPEAVAKPAAAKPADTAQSGSGLFSNPLLLGAAAGVLLCVVGLVLVLRRRRALPNDLDVTAIAEARDDAEAAYGTSNASTDDDSYSLFEGDDSTSAHATAPALRNTAPAASDADEASFASLFDEEDAHGTPVSQGAATMNQPTTSDFPMDRASTDRTAATVATPRPASAAPGADVIRLVQDLERRMGMLEKKLGEANDAREKLERQVAAQSEELRVQRAAIARTQRALRTMTRGEEDKATEPALREDPSGQTQSKTRINL